MYNKTYKKIKFTRHTLGSIGTNRFFRYCVIKFMFENIFKKKKYIYICSYVCFRGCKMGRWFFGCPACKSGPGKDGFRIDVSMASQSSFSRTLPAARRSRFRWHLSHLFLGLFLLLGEVFLLRLAAGRDLEKDD